MNKIYNWGIIGPGRIAHKFAEALQVVPNARLHAVASRAQERADAFAGQYGATHAYGSYEALATCPNLDAVYIASPHTGHCAHTILCLQAGIPVLCEKPFAMNEAEVQRMIDEARERRVFLMEAIWTRFLPTTIKALEMIRAGTIGAVHTLTADFGFKAIFDPAGRLYNAALGGGSWLDIGIYPAFLALLILGEPESVVAKSYIGSTGVDEDTGAILSYAGGQVAHLHSTIRARTKTEAFIYGEEGTIHIHSRWHEPTSMSLLIEGERPKDFFFEYTGNGYNYEIEEVNKCLEQGRLESDLLPLDFSLQLMRLLDWVRKEAGIVYS